MQIARPDGDRLRDSFAYAPVQDFGNAFSTYVAQNYGAGKKERISRGSIDDSA